MEATDSFDGDLTGDVRLDVVRLSNRPGVCTKKIGCDSTDRVDTMAPPLTSYRLTYYVSDRAANTVQKTRLVKVIDTQKPSLVLLGPDPQLVEGSTEYIDPKAEAHDTLDEDDTLTNQIRIGGDTVDIYKPAFTQYTVTYNVADTAGNDADPINRTVIISDTTKPKISLKGSAQYTQNCAARLVHMAPL